MEERLGQRSRRPRVTVDVDPELRRRLRLVAAARDTSIGEYVLEAIKEKLEQDAEDVADLEHSLAALRDRPNIRSYAEFLADLEAGRVSG